MTSPRDQITYTFRTDERDAVRGLGRLRDGMEDVDRLGKTLAKTQRAEADAAGRLRVAQTRLEDVRRKGKASAAQLATAEEAVAKAQRGLVASAGEARSSALSLAKVQERAGDSADRAGRKMRGLHRSTEDGVRGFGSIRKSIGGVTLGLGKMLGPLGLATAGVTAAGAGIVSLGLAAYKGASQLQLMDNKARIVFGKSFPELNKWAGRVANSMGLTRRELIGLAAGFADMLVPMGFSRAEAAKMARQFSKMAPVLANWSGGTFDTKQAAEALTGALTGEYDTLQRLGIPISDAQVQLEAVRLGLVKSTVNTDKLSIAQQRASLAQTRYNTAVKEHGRSSEEARRASLALQVAQNGVETATAGSTDQISQAAKAQAALSLIMKGSTDAQKAAASGQGTLARQSAQLKARFSEVRDELLVRLIPAFTKLGNWLLDHQDEIIEFGFRAAKGMITFGEGTALAFADVLEWIGAGSEYVGRFVKGMIGGFAAAGHASIALGALLGIGLSRRAREAGESLDRMSETAGQGLIDAGNKARSAAKSIRDNIPPAANIARDKLEEVRRVALGLPARPTVTPTVLGDTTAKRKMTALTRAANDIPDRVTVDVAVNIRGRDVTFAAQGGSSGTGGPNIRFAEGGIIPGYSPSDRADNIRARVTAGEYVIQRPTVRKLQRRIPGFLDRLNAGELDIGGDADHMRIGVGRPVKRRAGYATGGLVGQVQSFLRSTDPLPYIWGGAGPGGYDCSGLAGAAYGKLTGRGGGQGQRYFTTDTIQNTPGLRRGVGAFTVGVTPGRGHMAMQLGSLKAEARSTASGIIVGPGAASPLSFARKFFLPSLGGAFGGDGLSSAQIRSVVRMVAPAVVRQIRRELGIRTADAGAYLAPGLNPPIFNGTGRPETVTTAQSMDAVIAELRSLRRAILEHPTVVAMDSRPVARAVRQQNIRNSNGWG